MAEPDTSLSVQPMHAETFMRHSPCLAQLGEALSLAQQEIQSASKDSANPFFGSRYAGLASVWEACRLPLSKNGLAVLQPVSAGSDGLVTITTMLLHKSGEWVAGDLTMVAVQATPQGIGSAITYGRRYGLAAMVGVAPEDDDAEAAEGRRPARQPSRRTPAAEERPTHAHEQAAGAPSDLVKCPACGKTGTIIKERPEYGKGWVCWKRAKAGGCGAKFDTDPALGEPERAAVQAEETDDSGAHDDPPREAAPEKQAETADALFKGICNTLGGASQQLRQEFAKALSAHLAYSLGLSTIEELKQAPEADRLHNLHIVRGRAMMDPADAKTLVLGNARKFRGSRDTSGETLTKLMNQFRDAAVAAGKEAKYITSALVLLEADLGAKRAAGATPEQIIAYVKAAVKREVAKMQPAAQPINWLKPAPADLGVSQSDVARVAPLGPNLPREPGAYEADDDDVGF